jgi:hypothetical protein
MRITRNAAGPDQHKRDSYLYGSKETQPPVRVVHFKQHRRQHLMGVQQVVDVRSTVVAAGEAAAARDQGPAVGPAQHSTATLQPGKRQVRPGGYISSMSAVSIHTIKQEHCHLLAWH